MMNPGEKILTNLAFLGKGAFLVALALASAVLVNAAPSAPPSCPAGARGCDAPLTADAVAQAKAGGLTLAQTTGQLVVGTDPLKRVQMGFPAGLIQAPNVITDEFVLQDGKEGQAGEVLVSDALGNAHWGKAGESMADVVVVYFDPVASVGIRDTTVPTSRGAIRLAQLSPSEFYSGDTTPDSLCKLTQNAVEEAVGVKTPYLYAVNQRDYSSGGSKDMWSCTPQRCSLTKNTQRLNSTDSPVGGSYLWDLACSSAPITPDKVVQMIYLPSR